ncbi:MAG: CBS domain-containing protein [Candidatus Melainabacteria bacterium]|jgi:CBS domain-containing protein|nr:CBS domain-containing protein [Candidatus Melainabacteria bacterium]
MSNSDYIDEEMQIMEENQQANANIAAGINIEDTISTLSLVPIESVKTSTSLADVIKLLNSKDMGCVTITNSSADTIGIFTERDILRKVIGKDLDLSTVTIDNYMTKNPEVLSEEDPIAFALNRMSDGGYRHIPITRNGKVGFMLSIKDIVDQIAQTYRKRVLNLPPNLKQTTSQYGG